MNGWRLGVGWNLFHDRLEVPGFHGVHGALRLVDVCVACFHGRDVLEDLMVAEIRLHGV